MKIFQPKKKTFENPIMQKKKNLSLKIDQD